jgi:hypothetical protein
MNEITAWMQSNWYELGNLSVEIVFVSAGIWFARKILRSIRASQEQVGALIRLSVGGAVPERQISSAVAERPAASAGSHWLTPAESAPADQAAPVENGPSPILSAGHSLMGWLNTPMMKSSGPAPWRKAINWLRSPAGS